MKKLYFKTALPDGGVTNNLSKEVYCHFTCPVVIVHYLRNEEAAVQFAHRQNVRKEAILSTDTSVRASIKGSNSLPASRIYKMAISTASRLGLAPTLLSINLKQISNLQSETEAEVEPRCTL